MRILLAGDSHGNKTWFTQSVLDVARACDADMIVQLGDFGYWPAKRSAFLDAVRRSPLPVYFIDGNHENHPALAADTAQARETLGLGGTDPVPLGGALHYLPRGARLDLDGVRVAALGGAASIDRELRTPGRDWFPDETISDADLQALASAGPCDVLLTHDCPSDANVPLTPRELLSPVWQRALPACDAHRLRIDEAVNLTRPSLLLHGHYHVSWRGSVRFAHGDVDVAGLCGDSGRSGTAILECRDGVAHLEM